MQDELDQVEEFSITSPKHSRTQQERSKSRYSAENLPNKLLFHIFSFLNQKNILSVSLTCKRWNNLINENQLWKEFAKRAFIIINENETTSREKDYKALIQDHCTPCFIDLGRLNEGESSRALAISFDGSTVVGFTLDGATIPRVSRAFRWTKEKGMKTLGILNESFANCVSHDGSVVVGVAHDVTKAALRPFRWIAEKGVEFLDNLSDTGHFFPRGMSLDGSVVAGDAKFDESCIAFRWTADNGIELLEQIDIGKEGGISGISSDGKKIVGNRKTKGNMRAFQWTKEKGVIEIPADNKFRTHVDGISYDGSVIVGLLHEINTHSNTARAFRWIEEKGMQVLNKERTAWASCTNFDGSVVAGDIYSYGIPNNETPFRWTEEKGMEFIEELLTSKGVLPNNVTLKKVHAISSSGTILIGVGEYSRLLDDGSLATFEIAWRAVIPKGELF